VPRKSGLITVLQFDEQDIAALKCRRSAKGLHVVSYGHEKGAWTGDDELIVNALKRFARQQSIFGDDIFTVLPRHELTVRILTLPSHDPQEIAGMVRLSAEEHVPYSFNDLVIDQCILQRMSDGHARVLAVFAHKDLVERHVRILSEAGLEPQQIFVSTACLASVMFAAQGDTEERCALINLALGGMEILIGKGNVLEYGRAASMPLEHVHADVTSELAEELANEVRTSLTVFRREFPDRNVIDRLYLCSEFWESNEVAKALSSLLEEEVLSSRHGLTLCAHETPNVHSIPLPLLGGALTSQGRAQISVNLVPPSLTRLRQRATTRKAALMVTAAVGLFLISLLGLFSVLSFQRYRYIQMLTQRIEQLKPVAEEVVAKQRNLSSLQEKVDRSGTVLEAIARITELAPEEDLNFIKLNYDSRKGVLLQGRATDLAVVNRFSNTMRRSAQPEEAWLQEARQGKSTEVQERGKTIQQFEVEIPFPESNTDADLSREETFRE